MQEPSASLVSRTDNAKKCLMHVPPPSKRLAIDVHPDWAETSRTDRKRKRDIFKDLHFLQQQAALREMQQARDILHEEERESDFMRGYDEEKCCDDDDNVVDLCVDKDGKAPTRERMAVGCMISGVVYWRYRRTMLTCGVKPIGKPQWDDIQARLQGVVEQATDESCEFVIREAEKKNPDGKHTCCSDACWSSRGHHARHCTGIVVCNDVDGVISRSHVHKSRLGWVDGLSDELWTGPSGGMESQSTDMNMQRLKRMRFDMGQCTFDGDSEAAKAMRAHYPLCKACRDPTHIGKNVGKAYTRFGKLFKYSCSCHAKKNNDGTDRRDSSGKVVKDHNCVTVHIAKEAQKATSYILMSATSPEDATRKIRNMMDHFEGHCREGGGCVHPFPYEHKHPLNCKDMWSAIRAYVESNVIAIVPLCVMAKGGSNSGNTAESCMSMMAAMRNKTRTIGVTAYRLSTDVAVLSKNQSLHARVRDDYHWITRVLTKFGYNVEEREKRCHLRQAELALKRRVKQQSTEHKKQRNKKRQVRLFGKKVDVDLTTDLYSSGGTDQRDRVAREAAIEVP